MPSRQVVLLILGFWVAANAWLCYRDLRPRLFAPEGPPPITIDLADEARAQTNQWRVYQDGERRGYAQTWVDYVESDDTFLVCGVFKLWTSRLQHGDADIQLTGRFRVTREGNLREMSAEVVAKVQKFEVRGSLDGVVRDRIFTPHLRIPALNINRELPPVQVSARGSVLNPMQPVNRITGIRPGQRWRVPLVDPLGDVFAASFQRQVDTPAFVEAEVLRETRKLEWSPHIGERRPLEVDCLVIEYTGEELTGHTWVRAEDGLVLRQEVTRQGQELVLQRD